MTNMVAKRFKVLLALPAVQRGGRTLLNGGDSQAPAHEASQRCTRICARARADVGPIGGRTESGRSWEGELGALGVRSML